MMIPLMMEARLLSIYIPLIMGLSFRRAYSKSKRAPSTAFSMSSSSMFRNDKLTLLDDQFDQILADYSDEDIGELDPEDDEVLGDTGLTDPAMEGLYDSFLENLKIIGSRKRLVTRKPEESLDAIRAELKDCAKDLVEQYGIEDDFVEGEFRMPEPKKKSQWDVETILSSNSNIYNRPKLIQEISKGAPKIKLSRGMPRIVEEEDVEDSDDDSDHHTETIAINKGSARPVKETSEGKKARKNAVKEERRLRRLTKKATKSAFQSESSSQRKQLPNLKLQAHSIPIQ